MTTEKGKTIARWVPSDEFMSEYDRIFRKPTSKGKVPDDHPDAHEEQDRYPTECTPPQTLSTCR